MDIVNGPQVWGSLEFLSGPLQGSTFQISKPLTHMGREPNVNDLVIIDKYVSRQQARLMLRDGSYIIENLDLTSAVRVNGYTVQQALLNDGDIIGLGVETTFRFLTVERMQKLSGPIIDLRPMAFLPPPSILLPRPDDTQPSINLGSSVPSLEVSTNTRQKKQSYALTKQIINIGRDLSNDIVLKDPIVSSFHAEIVREGNQLIIVHPHPARQRTLNGLLYQGRKIQGDETFRKPLIHGDIFRIGDEDVTLITFVYNDGTDTRQNVLSPMNPTTPEILPSMNPTALEILSPMNPIRLDSPELTIGRGPDNTVVLSHGQVSRNHARLVREGGTYRIVDMNSTNHVYINSELIINRLLNWGDEIRIGPYKLVYEVNRLMQYDESHFIRIDAMNLKKSGNNNVTLLNDLSFTIPPRKFVALVGGSGAGKLTLMDALIGLRPAQQGKVLYNGQDYYHNLAAFRSRLGYVPTDDIVHQDLTIERALYYAAKLRLPSDFTSAQIQHRIHEVLEEVEMMSRRKLLVKKLSGGQRKRVCIALELLANPSLFFLDEPTSGFDPGLDRKFMFLMRRLADKGKTIVLVTQATNNINTCDYVCFLCQGGRMAFFGPPEEAKAYFGKTDFAEIYSSLEPTEENPNVPEEASARFKVSPQYKEYVTVPMRTSPAEAGSTNDLRKTQEVKRPKNGNPLKQFILLSQRNLELLINGRGNLIILLLQAPLIALLLMLMIYLTVGTGIFDAKNVVQCAPKITTTRITTSPQTDGFIGLDTTKTDAVDCNQIVVFLRDDSVGQQYVNSYTGDLKTRQNTALQDFIIKGGNSVNAQTALFLIAIATVLFGCVNGTREIVKEASIYQRERMVNLGIIPYVLSKMLVLGTLSLFQSAILIFILTAFEPLHQGVFLPITFEVYTTLALASLVGLMLGLTISAVAANSESATIFALIVIILQITFSGVIFPLQDYFLQLLGMLFVARWAIAGIGSSIGIHSDKIGGDRLFGNDSTDHGTLYSTYDQLDAIHHLLLVWVVLTAMIVFFGCVTAYTLKRRDVLSRKY